MIRWILIGLVVVVALGLGGFGVMMWRLPPDVAVAAEAPPAEETAAMIEALKPPKRPDRPLVAVVGLNNATETTDYIVPTGILRRADVADVMLLATGPGPVQLYPALKVEPDATTAAFDAAHPDGADYVIVPAMSRDDDPVVVAWLQQQAAKGAIVIGVCYGVKVVGAAGLLDGKRATTHWYALNDLLKRHPSIEYVADRRMVMDGTVATTTGITASMPMMLTLIEAIAGRARAEAVAGELGIAAWDARHASEAFRLNRSFATTVIANSAQFWSRDEFGVALEQGMDEAALALVADAWSRTYRSRAVSLGGAPIVTANGIRVLPDRDPGAWPEERVVSTFSGQGPVRALDQTLEAIGTRYGNATTHVVALQLEYPR